jgi:L-alanine-DL-glutamate epimerase-like enolase superfamily enzyme
MSARVAHVRIHSVDVPLLRPFVTAVRRTDHVPAVLVEVLDTDGRSGWGEAAASWRVTGESPAGIAAAVRGPLRDAVDRLPVDDPQAWGPAVSGSVVGNAAARSAVDCALWDLAAQEAGQPLAARLGGAVTDLETDMTLSAGAPEDLLARARQHVQEGFRTIKVKVSGGASDARALVLLRRELGDGVVLRVDANQAWDVDQAIATIRGWERAGVGLELVEQPVAAGDIEGMAMVRAAVDTRVLADESVWDTRDLLEVLRCGAADDVNIKLAKTGGITQALAMMRIAREAGVGVVVGCMMESHVAVGASAALAATLGSATATAQDLDSGLWLSASPVVGGLAYRGPVLQAMTVPGLGIRGLAPDGTARELTA